MTRTYSHPKWQFSPYSRLIYLCTTELFITASIAKYNMNICQWNKQALNMTLISREVKASVFKPSIWALGSSRLLITPLLSVALTATAVYGVILGSIPHPAGWWELSPWLQPLSSHPIWPGLQTLQKQQLFLDARQGRWHGLLWKDDTEDMAWHGISVMFLKCTILIKK